MSAIPTSTMPSAQAADALLGALVARFGEAEVLRGEAVPISRRADWSGDAPVLPLARLRPRETDEVAEILRLCSAHGVPVVPQGGLTGLAGAAVPLPGAVALSLERMNRVESVDAGAGTLQVQAGCTLQAVQEAAQAVGLLFGVDLPSRGSCQIGGNIATNAGGLGVLQFGSMREQVLGLEVVLADGSVLPMLRPMIKNNTGYDLKQCFVGAEGTLGVITRALLRMRPAPAARLTVLVGLESFDEAVTLLGRLQAGFPGGVAAFELMWRDFIETAHRWRGLREPFEGKPPMAVITELVGPDEAALREAAENLLGGLLEELPASEVVIAQSQSQAQALWSIREATSELNIHMHPSLNFDVSLPIAGIGAFAARCRAALDARWPRNHSMFFGHIGDGNLHVSIDMATVDGSTAHEVESLVYELVARDAGSISAEHGIGTHRKPFLGLSRTPTEMAAMRAIKHALDPKALMNPGRVFDPVVGAS